MAPTENYFFIFPCHLTLLSVICISIAGHARRQPTRQAGSLSLGALVLHFLPIPDNIVLPLQLSDHQEELILQSLFVLIAFFIITVFVDAVLPQKLEIYYTQYK